MPFLLTNIAGIYKGTGKGGKKLSTRMNELVDNFLSKTKAESEFGAIDDPSTYDYLIKTLEPFIYDETVDNKRNDLIAAKNQLQTTLDNAIQNKTYIEVNLNDGLQQIAKKYYKDPMAVILKTAEFYNAVKDNLDNEIVPRAIKQVGVGKSLPAELINYQKDISKKTKEITDLANYYIGGEAPPNPDAYGVFIQTNPDNGYPINIEVRQVTSLGGKLDGYSKTENLKYGGLPIYLNTFQKDVELKNDKGETIKGQTGETLQGTKEVANLLGNVYEKTKVSQKDEAGKDVNSEDVLRGSPPPTKMGGLAKMWAAGLPGGEVTRKSIEQQEKTAEQQWQNQEVDFSQLDSFGALSVGVPKNSVLKDPRNNYYYLDNSGKVSKATSKEALQNFVVKNGGKAEDVANKAFLVDSDFVKANPWVEQMPDGTTKDRIIDDNYTGGLTNISPVQSSLVQFSPAQSSPVGFSGNFKSTMPTSTPVSSSLKKEQPPKEYVGGQYDFKSIMEKGKNLLKSFVPKI